jgi:NADH:ubiquinone reductase (non-electrogenic)
VPDVSPIKGRQDVGEIKYDYLVYAVGAETQTFNIKGVKEHSCFMKELKDAQKVGADLRWQFFHESSTAW